MNGQNPISEECMTGNQLIKYLQGNFSKDELDLPIVTAYQFGDYHRTQAVEESQDVLAENVKWSSNLRAAKLTEDEESDDEDEVVVTCLVIQAL